MISSNQHFARETDQIESQWRLLTNRQHYARSIHRIKNPSERSELLAGIKDYSLILAAGCLEFLNGQAPAKRTEAALEMLHLTPISRRFTDTAISFGLCDASLAHDEGLVTELKSDLAHIFTPETSNNCGARDLCSIAAISDQELKSEAQGNIGSFDALRADLTRWSDIFRSEQKQLPEKINAALAIFLAIEAENDLRGGIRNEEVSSWIDYYDLTSIDSELIQVWLNYCDPLMR